MSVSKIAYTQISEVDFDDIKDMPDADLPLYFKNLAERASSAQLRCFLYGESIQDMLNSSDDEEDKVVKDILVSKFVERRVAGFLRIKEHAKSFPEIMKIISGAEN